jgi:hypothetical protein
MRRFSTILGVLVLSMGLFAGAALARGNDWGPVPPHGHVMLIGTEVVGGQVHFDRCVELAAGQPLRGPAHHNSVHTGTAGGSPFVQGALFKAGNWVVPLAPLTPFTGCADFSSPFPAP